MRVLWLLKQDWNLSQIEMIVIGSFDCESANEIQAVLCKSCRNLINKKNR